MPTFPITADTSGAVNNIDKLIAALRAAGTQAGMTEKEINDITNATKKAASEGGSNINNLNKQFDGLNDTIKDVGKGLLAFFAFDKIKDFVGQVVEVTSEFQKFSAVLTNTLGSSSQAQAALGMIQKFAAQTPFSVRELTESFVKLANQGFKPTYNQLRQLGDLASSTGKSFDQLTEAILDAQTGQFERLKEFGIKASKSGDDVTFAFKGVQTQVDFTSDAIQKYLLSLGDLEGVAGSMEAISKTLGGQISNLGDAWDNFLKTVGDGNNGVLSGAVSILNDLVAAATEAVKTTEQRDEEFAQKKKSRDQELFNAFAAAYKDRDKAETDYLKMLDDEEAKLHDIINVTNQKADYSDKDVTEQNKRYDRIEAIKTERDALVELFEVEKNDAAKKQQIEDDKNAAIVAKNAADAAKRWAALQAEAKTYVDAHNISIEQQIKDLDKLQVTFDDTPKQSDKKDLSFYDTPAKGIIDDKVNPDLDMHDDVDKNNQQRIDAEKDFQAQKKKEEIAGFNFTQSLLTSVFQMQSNNYQAQLDQLDSQYAIDTQLAGDNATAKAKIDREYNSKKREIQIKQAQAQKEEAIFSILLNTAKAIVSVAPNPVLIALAAATGAAELIVAQSQPIPKYADGVYGLQGPGTQTSDSILARLSVDESVVPARKSIKFKDILQPMIENDDFDYSDVRNIVDRTLPSSYAPAIILNHNHEMNLLSDKVDMLIDVIKNKPVSNVNIDEHGLYLYTQKENHRRTTYKKRVKWSE